jgi:hypothetical protein
VPSTGATPPSPLRLLVVVAQVARGEELRKRLARLAGDRPLELRVVAPAYAQSMIKYLIGDADEGIGRAHSRLEESVNEMDRPEDTTVHGEVGEADPLTAIEDALGSFAADEIVVLPSAGGDDQWAEKDLCEEIRKRFDLPVREIQLEEESGGA